MKKFRMNLLMKGTLFLIYVIFFSSCSMDPMEEEATESLNLSSLDEGAKEIKDQYIVLLSKHPVKDDPRAQAALEAVSKEVGQMKGAGIKDIYSNTITGFVAKMNANQAKNLRKDPRVISVTADRVIELEEASSITSGSMYEYPVWGLDRIDQRTTLLDRAYAYNSTGEGVTVYVMDSGIRMSHGELEKRATLGIDLVRTLPDETWDVDDPNIEDGWDCNGHGTHVSGTIGGLNYGVAKGVDLVSVRVFSCYGRTTWSRIISAVDWITANAKKPAIVNMSLGDMGLFEEVQFAMEESIQSGVNYVVAAGNAQMDACEYTPAFIPGVITVGASDIYNKRVNFSNYGDCLDLYAPGVSILSAGIASDTDTRLMSGTSMAAPHVAGIMALYLEKNPEATPAQVHAAIVENTSSNTITEVPSGPNNLAHSLWEPVVFNPPVHPDLNLRVYGEKMKGTSTIHLVWDPTDDPEVRIYRNGSIYTTWSNTGELSIQVSGKSSDSYRICEINYANCSRDVAADFSGETDFEPNKPPIADFTFEVNDMEVKFTNTSTDPDGTIKTSYLHFGDGYYVGTGNYIYTYREPGTYTATLYVTDNHEQTSSVSKEITVGTVDPSPEGLVLSATGYKVKGQWQTDLSWTPAGTALGVDLYRNGILLKSIEDTGSYTDVTTLKGGGTLTYRICHKNSDTCSNEETVVF